MRNSRRSFASTARASRRTRGGFTLLELVIVMGMLVMVLVTAYQLLTNVLDSEKSIEKMTLPEKVGGAIVSLIHRDLAGVFFRGITEQLNNQVFLGTQQDGPEGPQDSVTFLTSVDPSPLEEESDWQSVRTVTVVGYFLEPNEVSSKYNTFTLYRKEVSDFTSGSPLEAPGRNLVVYDKVKSLEFSYYDGYDWLEEWDSVAQIEAQARELAEQEEVLARQQQRIARVSDPEEQQQLLDQGQTLLPPAPIPTAVRIRVEIYAGVGREVFEVNDEPDVKSFTTIVPLLAAQRIPIQLEEDLDTMGGGVDGAGAGGGGDQRFSWMGGPGDAPGEGRGEGRPRGRGAPGGNTFGGARTPVGGPGDRLRNNARGPGGRPRIGGGASSTRR